MSRVSMRTLVLMLELLVAVVAFQYLAAVRPAKADAIWLAGDCITLAQPAVEPAGGTIAP
jgi:hypothetical protein